MGLVFSATKGLLPEAFSVGVTCQVADLLPSVPVMIFASTFAWQAWIGFR